MRDGNSRSAFRIALGGSGIHIRRENDIASKKKKNTAFAAVNIYKVKFSLWVFVPTLTFCLLPTTITTVAPPSTCGGQKVDQQPILPSSHPSIVVVQTSKDRMSDDA
jgi:hypothetical protein